MSINAIHRQAQLLAQQLGVSFRQLRYGTTVLPVNPTMTHAGLNRAYVQTRNILDALETWKTRIDASVFEDSEIPISALDPGERWQISEDSGKTWIDVFINFRPNRFSSRWHVDFARAVTEQNLEITYQVGQGTFTSDPETGNQVEDTLPETFYAVVSQQRNRTQFEQAPGLAPARIYLEGYFTDINSEPVTLPIDLQQMVDWPAVLTDPKTGLSIEGFFRSLIITQDADLAQTDKRGSRIAGWFSTAAQ